MNGSDFIEDGLTFEDAKKAAKIFSEEGYDALEISGGIIGNGDGPVRTRIDSKKDEAYHRDLAEGIAEEVSVPVILVGGTKSLEVAEEIIQETKIEALSLARPLVMEPSLIKRWMEGSTERATCISCNQCFTTEGHGCIFNKKS